MDAYNITLTNHETAIILYALLVAKRHDVSWEQAEYDKLFHKIAQQHDEQVARVSNVEIL